MSTSTYNVTGMTCGHCAAAVTEEVAAVPGVNAVEVDVEAGTVLVTRRRGQPTSRLRPPSTRPATRWPDAGCAAHDRHADRGPSTSLVGGMTCASCAAAWRRSSTASTASRATRQPATAGPRRSLHRRVDRRPGRARCEQTGYTAASRPSRRRPRPPTTAGSRSSRRLLIAAPLTVRSSRWRCSPACRGCSGCRLALAAPVVVWAGWPFHRAAAVNARHRAATMDTLVSLGTLVAFGWSLVRLLDRRRCTSTSRSPRP